MNSIAASKLSDEHVVLFFRKLKSELNCTSTGKLIVHVRQVMSRIKGFYDVSQLNEIISKTPPLLHFVLVGNCRYTEDKKTINHLDELVDALYREDQQTGKGLFKSEVETLRIVIVVLRRLRDLFARVGIQAFPYVLSNELHQAVIEEAA